MDNLTIMFSFGGNKISLQCQKNEKIEEVFKRFCAKAQLNYNDVKFYYNSTEFKVWGKTLEQLNLANFFTFEVVNDKTLRGA